MKNRIYLDYAATTPVAPEVLEAMLPYFSESWGNASAVYATGREARRAVEDARRQVAEAIGSRRLSRVVGYALHVNPEPGVIPCHRVVRRDGEVSSAFAFGGANRQAELLRAEGVAFLDETHVDMARCRVRALPMVI